MEKGYDEMCCQCLLQHSNGKEEARMSWGIQEDLVKFLHSLGVDDLAAKHDKACSKYGGMDDRQIVACLRNAAEVIYTTHERLDLANPLYEKENPGIAKNDRKLAALDAIHSLALLEEANTRVRQDSPMKISDLTRRNIFGAWKPSHGRGTGIKPDDLMYNAIVETLKRWGEADPAEQIDPPLRPGQKSFVDEGSPFYAQTTRIGGVAGYTPISEREWKAMKARVMSYNIS